MKKNMWAVWTAAALLSGTVAWGQSMAPVNPAFARWQREKAAKGESQGGEAGRKARGPRSPAARGEAGGEEMDFGFVPTVLDMGYLSNLNDNMTQGVGDELPSSFDLREEGALTAVRDQGSYGNCWAFAALGSLESWVKKSEGAETDFSENHLANLHGWHQQFGEGGNAQMASGYLLRWAGPVEESADPYPGPGKSPAGAVAARHVQRVRWIPGKTGYLDHDGIKAALRAWGALQADYYHANGYYNAKKASYYFNAGTSFRLSNHAVDLVGWDDGYSRKNFSPEPPGDGAYLVRNSWGSGWGEGGYFHVSYYDESFGWGALHSFSSAEGADNYDGVYQHDPLGMVGAIGYNGPTAWGANLFTATNASKVAAAGFYAMTPRTTYTLRVYTGCTAGQPTSGTLASEQSGTVDVAGYVTVPLERPAAVSAGQRFSVVVQLTTPGYAYPLAMEYAVAGYTPGASAGAGESFLSANGSSWSDFTKRVNSTANFCCKAYVKAGTAAKRLSGIAIDGVNSLDAGASAAFKCMASYSDGSSKAVTPRWSISEGSAWASVDALGTVTAKATDAQRTVTVKAAYSEGGVSASATWTLLVTVAAPGAPSGLTATEGTEESCVRLAWTASAGVSSYAVYRGTKESSGKAGYLGTVTVPRYADTAAVPGVDYRYFVKAKNGSGSSAFSEGAWGWRALAAPTELAASDGSREDRVDVTWNRSEGASHYRVWRAEGEGDFEAISGWQTACQFADETAEIGTVYTYAVTAALDADGTRESALSVPDEGFRTGPKTLKALEIGGPVSLGSGARGTYSCTAVYTDGTRVQVTPEWSLTGGTLAVSGANAVVTAPAASENTTATLKADYTDGVTRSASLTIMVTPAVPAAPTGLAVASADGNGITLKWNAVANASSYQLWRATADEESAVIASTTATRHTDATAVPGVAYTYRVAAANGAGAGAPCVAGVTATRPIAAPTGVSASYGTFADKVLVSWRACEGAAFYRVWRADSAEGEKTALGEWQAGLSFEDTSAEAGTVYYYSVQAAADAVGTAASAFGGPAVGLRKVAPKPVALSIVGPERVAAESTAAYMAKVKYENGSTQTVVPVWYLASGNGFASIGSDGLLTVGALTDDQTAIIGARFTDGTSVEVTLEVALVAPIVKTATVSDVEAHARWPWNGWVDVDYTLEIAPSGTVAKIILSGYDLDHKSALAAATLAGDGARGGTVEPGRRRISWNLGVDYPGFHASQVSVSLNAVVSEPVEPEPEDNSLAEGLVAWYAFDGDAKDASGNGNHGTVNGATLTSDRNGKANGAYYFDGNDTITVSDSVLMHSVTNAFTIATWMRYDAFYNSGGDEWVSIVCKGTTQCQFSLNLDNTASTAALRQYVDADFTQFPEQGKWVHLVVSLDSEGVATSYLNGIQVGVRQNGIILGDSNTQALVIGADPPGLTEYLYGALDDLGIWNRSLTAEEVARLYAGERPAEVPVLMGDWYVSELTGNDANDGRSWATAKKSIQAAVDASVVGETILVADGTYAPIVTDNKAITIRSVNGAEKTFIDGGGTQPCAILAAEENCTNSVIVGFTIQNAYGNDDYPRTAIRHGTIKNCIVRHNSNLNWAFWNGVAENCLFYGNTGTAAIAHTTVLNCTIADNSGYGTWDCSVTNSIIWGNGSSVYISSGHSEFGPVSSCYESARYDGEDSIHDNPMFVDAANGDYRLATRSPCIDAGDNAYVTSSTDLGGNARIVNGTVDIGCYEYGGTAVHSPVWKDESGVYRSVSSDGKNRGVSLQDACLHLTSGAYLFLSVSGPGTLQFRARGSYDGFWYNYDNGHCPYIRNEDSFLDYSMEISGAGVHTVLWLTYDQGDIVDNAWGEIKDVFWNGVAVPLEGAVESSLADGLVAYWPFDGDAKDASGNGNDGTVNGATLTSDRNGKADGAYFFDGNDKIVVPDSLMLRSPSNAITIAVWMNTSIGDRWVMVCCKGTSRTTPVQYGFGIWNNDSGSKLELGSGILLPFAEPIETDTWHHMVATWDGETAKCYQNGILIAQTETNAFVNMNGEDFVIACDAYDSVEYYRGILDDLAIWNRALTEDEAGRLYAGERPVGD